MTFDGDVNTRLIHTGRKVPSANNIMYNVNVDIVASQNRSSYKEMLKTKRLSESVDKAVSTRFMSVHHTSPKVVGLRLVGYTRLRRCEVTD